MLESVSWIHLYHKRRKAYVGMYNIHVHVIHVGWHEMLFTFWGTKITQHSLYSLTSYRYFQAYNTHRIPGLIMLNFIKPSVYL